MLGNLTEINSELALADALLFPFAFDIAENLLITMKLLALDIFISFQNLGLDIKLCYIFYSSILAFLCHYCQISALYTTM